MGTFDSVIDNIGEEWKGGKGFEYGTHEVVIGTAEAKQKKTKKADDCAAIEVVVFDENDNEKKATCTLWFHTDGAAKMSVTKVLGLLIHSVGEEKKEAVRELAKKLFGSIDDNTKARDVANKLINDKLLGKKAFIVVEPQGNYSTSSYADLWHYAAKPEGEPADEAQAVAKDVGGSVADDVELPDGL